MLNTVYHASPDLIKDFDFTHGVHFGGKFSALEAGNRKLQHINIKDNIDQSFLYLYTIKLNEGLFYETTDVGGNDAWLVEILRAKSEGYSLIKYEPDTVPSYIILDNNIIK